MSQIVALQENLDRAPITEDQQITNIPNGFITLTGFGLFGYHYDEAMLMEIANHRRHMLSETVVQTSKQPIDWLNAKPKIVAARIFEKHLPDQTEA
jgi:hypothetical protein